MQLIQHIALKIPFAFPIFFFSFVISSKLCSKNLFRLEFYVSLEFN